MLCKLTFGLGQTILAGKVNSVQEGCAKCFAVYILEFETLQTTRKKRNKKHQNGEKLKTKSDVLCFIFFI